MFLMNRGKSRFDAGRAGAARAASRLSRPARKAKRSAMCDCGKAEDAVPKAGEDLIVLAVLLAEARNPHHAVDRGD